MLIAKLKTYFKPLFMTKKLSLSIILLVLGLIHVKAQTAPGGVTTDLNYWLKADAGTTTFPDAIGGVPITRVSSWENQTSMSTNSISGIANFERPLLIENSLNFNPAINFDGNNDFLRTNENSWDANTVIMVFNPYCEFGNTRRDR